MGHAHGRKWSDKDVELEIIKIKETMGYNHFPTHSEIISFYGNSSLTNKISKSGGTRYWAKRLNLPLKECESEFGNDYELRAIKEIEEFTGLSATQTNPRYPYDLLVGGCVKVDVKVSFPFKNNCNAFANTFNLEKKDPTCDIFVMYCLDLDGNAQKTLIIPSSALSGKTQVGVGKESKWDVFDNCWHYIAEYDSFFKNIKQAN